MVVEQRFIPLGLFEMEMAWMVGPMFAPLGLFEMVQMVEPQFAPLFFSSRGSCCFHTSLASVSRAESLSRTYTLAIFARRLGALI
mmetsp:Transcript_20189/g.61450  ORF Transcript_20189/g.61450 Transcript_20189/m.61450 type:complete len:85 (-) Transcript_20189:1366-1620(-)|eukprot:scaffold164864_cov29-Tisochrysis_lutea.AAC.1